MAQVVSRRPLTTEARVHARVNPCGICDGQSGTGTGFSPSSSVFLYQYNSAVDLQTHIVWRMNNMSASGSSSETSSDPIEINLYSEAWLCNTSYRKALSWSLYYFTICRQATLFRLPNSEMFYFHWMLLLQQADQCPTPHWGSRYTSHIGIRLR
jgi:hypothetical protein